ncbi:uncharacterized protein [Antedon mediterranea]|uniref:uncharacterized protein n=1 Tax=Antedon mediterranea TaxID=105859 RepID=UPI003AF6641C
MGKIKRKRSKYHLPVSKLGQGNKDIDTEMPDDVEISSTPVFQTEGLFSLPNFDLSSINTQLKPPEDDTRSFISKKSIKDGQQLKKKDKMKIRHDKWLEKIETVKSNKKKKSEAKKRANTAIVGDLQPLTEALPELTEILKITKRTNAEKHADSLKKKSGTWKAKDRQKHVMNELAKYKQVLNHTSFKSNALATINEHLKNTIDNEKDERDDG